MKKLLAALTLSVCAVSVHAAAIPDPGKKDFRVRTVEYRADDVTVIHSHFGFLTNIVFSPGERILENGIFIGDTGAWSVTTLQNHLFVKPVAEGGRTNMTVITNFRTYNLELVSHWPKGLNPYPSDMQFQVNFRYPGDDAKAAQTEAIRFAAIQSEAEMKAQLHSRPAPKNWNYSAEGSQVATPDAAWDDGRFTYFRFSGSREMPAVFVVNDDGSESLINRHVEGDTIVVQTTGKKFVLRRGRQATCVFNDSYQLPTTPDDTATTSGSVIRVIKGKTQ